jgi:immune inhibitor A
VNRRILGVMGGLASAALIATALPTTAAAAPPENPQDQGSVQGKKDDRPDKLEDRRRDLNKRAQEMVLRGQARVQDRDGSQAVKVAPGQWAQYGTNDSDQLLSFLVEFGGSAKGGGKGKPTGGTTDPTQGEQLHNSIPKPAADDNSTYWEENFDRAHYMKMFFSDTGESFKDAYEEMSSGRYTVNGDVSEWVKVDKAQADYGTTESHADMTYFIDDSAEAWYDAQVAAGKSRQEIVDYLKGFDKWDRFDIDGDGNFNEPDGYVDHFQAIHAGEGEEAGAPEGAIWSHRWAVNQNGFHSDGIGPEGYGKAGGIEIGDTDIWIRDYTTEPENGGLGVFVHEYAHDLGLPDLYDTQGGENGTGFWTLMSSGSWLGHGDGAIGTTPNHMGPWEKFQLGWLDYDVARTGTRSEHELGPSYHATKKAQALITILPKKSKSENIGAGDGGASDDYYYSGVGNDRNAMLTSPAFTVPTSGGQLAATARYEIEVDWDYAYVEVSTDGGSTWTPIATSASRTTNPNGSNDGFGITGFSNGWGPLTASLNAYAGKEVKVRFRMENDAAVTELGFLVDDITVSGGPGTDADSGANGWTMDKFSVAEDGVVTNQYNHYYIAENRTYGGYDSTLKTGPYNFGFGASAPNKVEHFPYQDGLLVWYWDTSYGDNNTSAHPGGGEALPIDARAQALRWSNGTIARNRIQSFDATFGLEPTDPISLHLDTATGPATLAVPSRAGVAVFDDTDPMRYYDESNPRHSAIVGGTGTTIRVETTSSTGMMKVIVE